MPRPVVRMPDSVFVVVQYLRSAMPGVTVLSRTPNPRPAEFIRIERIGGIPRSRFIDRPRIDVECWSGSEEGAEALMSTARGYVHAIAGKRGTTTVYDLAEVSGPMWLPDSESGQPRYSFAVEFSARGTEMD